MTQPVDRMINAASRWSGSTYGSVFAATSLLAYLAGGLHFGFSEGYNLVANTWMSAVSYLLLFFIQRTQNRESKAGHIKLDEILFAIAKADNRVVSIESLDDEQLSALEERYQRIADQARRGSVPEPV